MTGRLSGRLAVIAAVVLALVPALALGQAPAAPAPGVVAAGV